MRFALLLSGTLLAASALAVPSRAAASYSYAEGSFSGTYTGKVDDGTATLTLKQEADGSVTGTVRIGADTMGLKGRAEGEKVSGTVQLNGMDTPIRFEIKRSGKNLRYALLTGADAADEDDVIVFTGGGAEAAAAAGSKEPKRPEESAAKSKPAPTKSPLKSATASPAPAPTAGWKSYKHPSGLSFRYPADWTTKEANGIVVILPPGVEAGPQAQEVYGFRANPTGGGITSANDPAVTRLFDQELEKNGLKRSGDGEALPGPGGAEGRLLTYTGSNPTTGKELTVRAYATVQKQYLMYLVAFGSKEKVAARDKTLRGIFTTIGAAAAERDPQLVGVWQSGVKDGGRLLSGVGGKVTGSTASDSWKRYTLAEDGSLVEENYSRTIAGSGGVFIDTGDSIEKKRGRWTGGGGKLTIFMDDGRTMNLGYKFNEGHLVVLFPGGGGEVYARRQ